MGHTETQEGITQQDLDEWAGIVANYQPASLGEKSLALIITKLIAACKILIWQRDTAKRVMQECHHENQELLKLATRYGQECEIRAKMGLPFYAFPEWSARYALRGNQEYTGPDTSDLGIQ